MSTQRGFALLLTFVTLLIAAALAGCRGDTTAPDAPARVPAEESAAEAGPRFTVESRDGVLWIIDPARGPFFSRGVCVVNPGIAREEYDPAKPGYAAWRHHPDTAAWAESTLARLRSWGFTTLGGWADSRAFLGSPSMDLALTPVLAAGMEAGVPWFDLWDPEVIARVEALARERIEAVRDYPRVIGYYTDNELGWWNGILLNMTFKHPERSGQRRRLVKLLRETYRGSWDDLLRDFDPEGAGGFDALDRAGMLYVRPGGDGIRLARRFLELVAERYYDLLAGIVRRHDRRALVLGDRFQSFYYPEVARAAGRHADLVSTNLNAHWSDGTFARFYLDTLRDLCGKPIIVSELYLAASENRSGNPNDRGVYPVVPSQRERAEGYRRTLTSLLALPYVVGADWFQYYDEPPLGRFDGENFNFGLVDIEDRPYEELVAAAAGIDAARLHARPPRPPDPANQGAHPARSDARAGVPPAPPDPFARFEPNHALEEWDRERGFVPPASRYPLADLYLAWSPEGLYLGLFAIDIVEESYYRDGKVPEADRMVWSFETGGMREPIRLRLGAGLPPSGAPPDVAVVSLSGKALKVRVIAAARIPARLLGRPALAPGDSVRLASTLTTHGRAYRMEWKGEFRLSR